MSLFIKRKKKSETFNINGKKMHNFPNTPKKKKKKKKKKGKDKGGERHLEHVKG